MKNIIAGVDRKEFIALILNDLRKLQSSDRITEYAIEHNIKFFDAAKSIPSFIVWLVRVYPHIDRTRIKELADFHLRDGFWEEYLLKELVRLEKSRIIDLVGPLRKELLKQFNEIGDKGKKPMIIVNIGCGAMEIERQVANLLKKHAFSRPIIWIGIDNSPASLTVAKQNLQEYYDVFHVGKELSNEIIEKLKSSTYPHVFQFILGDANASLVRLSRRSVDIAFYSKFLHHLSDQAKIEFKKNIMLVAKRIIEFDDYRGIYLPLMSLITNWRSPVLLNGAVFSSLRVPSLSELYDDKSRNNWKTSIIHMKGYLKTYCKY